MFVPKLQENRRALRDGQPAHETARDLIHAIHGAQEVVAGREENRLGFNETYRAQCLVLHVLELTSSVVILLLDPLDVVVVLSEGAFFTSTRLPQAILLITNSASPLVIFHSTPSFLTTATSDAISPSCSYRPFFTSSSA